MLKNVLHSGYSSQVRGWLVIDEVQHELAQVGPDFCILLEPIFSGGIASRDTLADLIIEVDGDTRTVTVTLSSDQPSSPKRLQFRRIHPA